MPVPTPSEYKSIIENAKANKFALPAINVASMTTANAALAAFSETNSDGIIQFSIGAGKFASGSAVNDAVKGAISLAEHVHRMAKDLNVYVALHTDHCQKHELDFVRGLLEESKKRVEKGEKPLFNGHMFDGSALSLKENMDIAKELLADCAKLGIVLEVEAGIVGGEEDGAATTDDNTKLYTTPEDMLYVANELFPLNADFMFAATFGNVHGIYKPGNVKLSPEILKNGQAAVSEKYGSDKTFDLVFHGGSGTPKEQIQETLDYGVIKMNVDTATQYSFTLPIAEHVIENQDKIVVAEGNKKLYDPRAYLKKAEASMKERVIQALEELKCKGNTFYKN
jgi:fructose-bisphosphate aldolase class II